ncbi:ankyrin repeat domain-containing protein [Bradyrhizobium pachyrhizi]|uniref:ankyrin repeat domain-containing protein n=1 Tax=Bradyrhizobium pachyrhizi TaxID=280333 RepID=UPI00067AFF79|nr:ankyrin repeat domain-containing protein [Bradyrhizobium pachyrhizi]
MTNFIEAAHEGGLAAVQALVAKGAALNVKSHDGSTALTWVARNGHTAIVELIEAKQRQPAV